MSVVAVRGGLLRETATNSKTGLGGHAFDETLVDFLVG